MMISQARTKFRVFSLAITVLGVLLGCGGQPVSTTPERSQPAATPPARGVAPSPGQVAVSVALRQIGVPYRYGGSDRSGFDCSGLVQYSYSKAGIRVPRTTGQLWRATSSVSKAELRPGDLLFFDIEGKPSHVGMYVGEGDFVHAPSSGRTVVVGSLDTPFYRRAFLRGGRVR